MSTERIKLPLHPNWANLSEAKKDLYCATFKIDREGYKLEGAALNGINEEYKSISGPGWLMVFKPKSDKE